MIQKAIQKAVSHLKFEWVLIGNIVVALGEVVSLYLITARDVSINQEQAMMVVRGGHVFTIVASIVSCAVMLIFRSRVNKLFDTIKKISDGDLDVPEAQREDSKYQTAYNHLSLVVDELKRSKEEMEQFTNTFLHEFKTPITAIHGFAEHLMETGEGVESEERMRYLQIISDESIRLSELSQKALLLAKVEACQIVTDKTDYDLSEQLKRCVILLLAQIEAKDIELDVDVEGLAYYGNAELMEQAWLNLLSNAIKFTPDHGKISISGTSDAAGITLTFTDNGPGMDEETQQHLFEKYYQGNSGRKMGGNGIGLSIVHRIITLCNGSITVTSHENTGSAFQIFLPRKQGNP